jgi:putative membrane protein
MSRIPFVSFSRVSGLLTPATQSPQNSEVMKLLTITFSAASVVSAILVKNDLKESSTFDEIVLCQQATQDASTDQSFVLQAAEASQAEVALGTLASERASSDDVKNFGRMMVTDHDKANEELKALAQKKGITLRSGCDMCQQKRDQLQKLSGKDFDKKYMEMMVADHKEVIDEFSKEQSQGKDKDVKSWAREKLPTLQHHLSTAENTKQ